MATRTQPSAQPTELETPPPQPEPTSQVSRISTTVTRTIDSYSTIKPYGLKRTDGPNAIVVVGAGGIGARVLPTLVKLLQDHPTDPQGRRTGPTTGPRWTVHVVDMDRVEERNLLRQPFTAADVGEFKAQVMANRYSTEAIPVVAWNTRIEEAWNSIRYLVSYNNVVILGCLDAVAPRRWIKERVDAGVAGTTESYLGSRQVYIDAGNDGNRGQVLLAAGLVCAILPMGDSRYSSFDGTKVMPEVFHGEDAPSPSCGVTVDTQTPLANNMAATLMLNYLGALLTGDVIGSVGLTFNTSGGVNLIPGRVNNLDGFQWWPEPIVQAVEAEYLAEVEKYQDDRIVRRAMQRLDMARYPTSVRNRTRLHALVADIKAREERLAAERARMAADLAALDARS